MDVLSTIWDIMVSGVFGNAVVGAIWTGVDKLNGYVLSPVIATATRPLGTAGELLYTWTQNTIGSAKVDLTIQKHDLMPHFRLMG